MTAHTLGIALRPHFPDARDTSTTSPTSSLSPSVYASNNANGQHHPGSTNLLLISPPSPSPSLKRVRDDDDDDDDDDEEYNNRGQPVKRSLSCSGFTDPQHARTESIPFPSPRLAPGLDRGSRGVPYVPDGDEDRLAPSSVAEQVLDNDVQSDREDQDEGIGDLEDSASTKSLDEECQEYQLQYGRRYHAPFDGNYFAPNDNQQYETQEAFHKAWKLMLKHKLYEAPIKQGIKRVLDVGSGSGQWAIDFADHNPGVAVFGMDISPTQYNLVPPNLQFQQDDCTKEWNFRHPFDYIHIRWLGAHINRNALAEQAFKSMNKGGYIELCEPHMKFFSHNGSTKKDSSLHRCSEIWNECGQNLEWASVGGKPGVLKSSLMAAGFDSVSENSYKMPIGTWPKTELAYKIGKLTLQGLEHDLEGLLLRPAIEGSGMTEEQVEALSGEAIREMSPEKNLQMVVSGEKPQLYMLVTVAFGRKPS